MPLIITRVFEWRPHHKDTPGVRQRALADNGLWYMRRSIEGVWGEWEADIDLNKQNPSLAVIERKMSYSQWHELRLEEVD